MFYKEIVTSKMFVKQFREVHIGLLIISIKCFNKQLVLGPT